MTIVNRVSNRTMMPGITPIPDVPDAPTIGAVTDTGDGTTATVAYTAAVTGGTVTTFTATSTPGSFTGTGSSPISVTGLASGTAYTFKVKGTNATATGPESAASSSLTLAPPPSYDSIATVTLSGTQSTISFNSIPSTYKHLQLRYFGLSASMGSIFMQINGDTSVSNYVTHYLSGDGASVNAGTLASNTGRPAMSVGGCGGGQFSTTYPYVGIIDILDYTNTNKYHVVRTLNGTDTNNTGYNGVASLLSGLHLSTTAVSSLSFYLDGNVNFTANTKFALYGIKG